MKKVILALGVVILGLIFLRGIAFAAEKFAYVSIDRIGDAYQKAKDYMKELEDKERTYSAEVEKKRNEVKQFQDKINLLSEKEREAKNTELDAKIKSLQEFVQEKQSDLRKEQVDKTLDLSRDIKNVIDKFAEKEGYTFVFDAAALAYQPKGLDISDKIIDILNKEYGTKK
jgi:outer membrane protein